MNSASSEIRITRRENDEKEKIEELKIRLKDELPESLANDDDVFSRFLRARDYSVKQAEEMLRNHINWRRKYDIDNIEQYKKPEVNKYYEISLLGFDKEGSIVRYSSAGGIDAQAYTKTLKYEDCVKCVAKTYEEDAKTMKMQSEKLGKTVDKWVYIINFENYSFAKATDKAYLKTFARLAIDYDSNYPERTKSIYIINASLYFTLFYNVWKPILSPVTLSKFQVFGKASSYFTLFFNVWKPLISSKTLNKIHVHGKDGWKEKLLSEIDADQLPAFMGGNKTDPDGNPNCLTFINQYGTVPKSYYLRSSERRLCNQPGVKKIDISSRSKQRVTLDVIEPESIIEWEFESESHDIRFGLYYQSHNVPSKDTKPELLIPKQRYNAHLASEGGIFRCQQTGKYILVFDNSYSIFRHKEIFYRASVKKPDGKKTSILN